MQAAAKDKKMFCSYHPGSYLAIDKKLRKETDYRAVYFNKFFI